MSAKSKGRANEKKVEAKLMAEGWLCERVKGGSKFAKSIDFFGLWDIIAVKAGDIKWVQSKTNRLASPADRAAMAAFPGPGSKELWVWYDRVKEPRIILLKQNACGVPKRHTPRRKPRPS